MSTLTDIQRAFVDRYMNDDNVIGVRIRKIDNRTTLFVEVTDPGCVNLPETFRDLPVVVREGRRGVLAYV
jgi:hypothetical protein